MTPQEIFDKVWDHLNRQGRPATGHNGMGCHYRAPDGAACAVGCLVDDETAKRWDNYVDQSIEDVVDYGDDVPHFVRENVVLLKYLQLAHDDPTASDWLTEWRDRMAEIAERHNLTVPPIPDTNA